MIVLKGKGVSGGIAIGPIAFRGDSSQLPLPEKTEDPQRELDRLEDAFSKARDQLDALYERARKQAGEENASIFETHQLMLSDPDFLQAARDAVEQDGFQAPFAVFQAQKQFEDLFASMEDEYMRGRAADVRDVSHRILDILSGKPDGDFSFSSPAIIAAEDLAPSETLQMDKSRILAFVTGKGSSNSHTAILAKGMGIPAVIGVGEGLSAQYDGVTAAVDGFSGTLYVDPDSRTLAELRSRQEQLQREAEELLLLRSQESVSLDGRRVEICANISGPDDIERVLELGGDGVGLFRSEFLYLESRDYPSEDQQYRAYRQAARRLEGRRLIVRTLDVGADKQVPYFRLSKEENPAMGCRAIRLCLERPELFKTQLRALLRAGTEGNLSIMFPMITSLWEIKRIRQLMEEARQELRQTGLPYSEALEIGMMIETPAAALISDLLAPEVDFFSIGTNDLIQYTLAVDRQNPKLDQYRDPRHPAVMRLISMVVENAHKAGDWVGICGELAADVSLTPLFLSMGVDELSVSPSYLLPVRRAVRETDVGAFQMDAKQ